MKLHPPLRISSRLLPAVQIEDAWLSLEPEGVKDDRLQWRYYLDVRPADGEPWSESDNELCTAPQHTDNEEGYRAAFGALLSFLSAAAESYPDGENADLFPERAVLWAYQNSNEITMLQCELEEEGS